jgi:hypothetical protein
MLIFGTDVLKVSNARGMATRTKRVTELAGLGFSVLLVRACKVMVS